MKSENIIKRSIVIDNAFGFEPEIEVSYKWDVLDRFHRAGFTAMSLSVATDMTSLAQTMHYLAGVRDHIQANPEKYMLIKTVEDIEKAKREGKLGLSFMFQGANPLEKRLELVESFSMLGVKSLLISYNARNAFGDGCVEEEDAGLSRLGRELIKTMNKHGVLIDVSHSGRKTSLQAIELSTQPVIFSHSNVNAIHPHVRNLTDEQIKAVAQSGGFIGINGNGPLLGDPNASISKYVDHMDYIIQLVGDDYVGLGTDLVYFREIFGEFMAKNSVVYPGNYGVKSIDQWQSVQPQHLVLIVDELLARGYQEATIRKILGGNYLRVANDVWSK